MKRIILKMVPKAFQTGISFYDFPDISDFNDFKVAYRNRLDSLYIDDAMGQSIVQEARLAFQLNMNITEALL